MPTNITPETATPITALPFAITEDVVGAPAGTGYVPSCTPNQTQAVWFSYVPPFNVSAIGLTLSFDSVATPGYEPALAVWTGDPLAQVTLQCFLPSVGDTAYISISVTPGETYYFQIVNQNALAGDPASFTLAVVAGTASAAPAGSLMVPNDFINFPNVIMSSADGSILQVNGFPACEMAEWLPNGTLAVLTETATAADAVSIYNSQLVLQLTIAGLVTSGVSSILSPICSNGLDRFYIADRQSTDNTVRSFLADGTIEDTWVLSPTQRSVNAIGVNADETILYTSLPRITTGGGQNLGIGQWDLVNNVALAYLVTPVALTYSNVGRDLPVLSDGSILWAVKPVAAPSEWQVLRYSDAGVLLNTYNIGSTTSVPRLRVDPTDTTTFWVMDWPVNGTTGQPERFQQFRISDGTLLATRTATIKEQVNTTEPLFGPSQSCPLLMNPAAITVFTEVRQAIRRLRRFPLPYDRSLFIYLSRIEFILQSGQGLPDPDAQGYDPLLQVRFSPDGGVTWGNWINISAGKQGQYQLRPVINRIGKLRNGVCEIAMSDPTFWYLLDCLVDGEESTGG